MSGVYIFHSGAKIWVFGWLGKKYDDLLYKKANIMGKGIEKREKGENFTVLGEKNMILEKRGGGKNIQFLGNIYPCNMFQSPLTEIVSMHREINTNRLTSETNRFHPL